MTNSDRRTMDSEPVIAVGLLGGASSVKLTLTGPFVDESNRSVPAGGYTAEPTGALVTLNGPEAITSPTILLTPLDFDRCRFTVHGITIGIDFHWERQE